MPAVARLLLAAATLAGCGAAQQFILDDMNRSLSIRKTNAHEGTFYPCMKDAFGGQFHHDWAENKGGASFAFEFEVPADGCYSIQEYHPGKCWSCRRYLPQNAQLDIDYCKGLFTTVYINQACERSAGQWNDVGAWMFFKGHRGALTMRNHADERCAEGAGKCFWIVDAFRLTRIGDSCDGEQQEAATAAEAEADEGEPAEAWDHEGLLSLVVADVDRDMLWELRGEIGETLKVHFGLEEVQVLSIDVSVGRRLQAARAGEFDVRFLGRSRGAQISTAGSGNLQGSLGDSLDLDVLSASVEWTAMYPSGSTKADRECADCEEEQGVPLWAIVVAAVAAVALVALALAVLACRWRSKAQHDGQTAVADVEAAEAKGETNAEDAQKEAKAELEVASVSTGTPPDGEESPRSDGRPSTPDAAGAEPVVAGGSD